MLLEGDSKIYSEPSFSKNLAEYGQVLLIEFSPFECSQDVLLIGFKERIVIGHLNLNVCNLKYISICSNSF